METFVEWTGAFWPPDSTYTNNMHARVEEVWERNSWLRYYCFGAATILMLCIWGQETQ
jgi:hypothetical protein